MSWRFNPFTGTFDQIGSGGSGGSGPDLGDKYANILASLAAFDRVVSITYHDLGLRTQRVNQIVASSSSYPDANVTKTVSWLDVGLLNQRIDKIEYTGAIFDPDSLRKVFSYSLNGIKYVQTGFNFETF